MFILWSVAATLRTLCMGTPMHLEHARAANCPQRGSYVFLNVHADVYNIYTHAVHHAEHHTEHHSYTVKTAAHTALLWFGWRAV